MTGSGSFSMKNDRDGEQNEIPLFFWRGLASPLQKNSLLLLNILSYSDAYSARKFFHFKIFLKEFSPSL